jgi:DNA-directed RNA polymerase specialized sigma24 family protein
MTITLSKARAMSRKEIRRRQLLQRAYDDTAGRQTEPSPEFAIQVADQLQQLMSRLDEPLLQQIAVAKLEGYRNEEIAQQIGKSTPTVERKLRRIRELWSDFGDGLGQDLP